jgi:hypothetical protein
MGIIVKAVTVKSLSVCSMFFANIFIILLVLTSLSDSLSSEVSSLWSMFITCIHT